MGDEFHPQELWVEFKLSENDSCASSNKQCVVPYLESPFKQEHANQLDKNLNFLPKHEQNLLLDLIKIPFTRRTVYISCSAAQATFFLFHTGMRMHETWLAFRVSHLWTSLTWPGWWESVLGTFWEEPKDHTGAWSLAQHCWSKCSR